MNANLNEKSTLNIPSLDTLLDKAHAIGEAAAAGANEADKNCRLHENIIQDMVDAQIIQVLQPQRIGGLELGFPAMVRISQAIAQHDMGASWIYSLYAIHHWWGAFTTPEMQDELWKDDPHTLFSDVFAPTGKATAVDDGYKLNGRWNFCSGVHWAKFIALGGMIDRGEGKPPEYRMFFLPKGAYEIIDDWDTLGMRSSGSCSVQVEDAFIPEYRTVDMMPLINERKAPGHAVNKGPLYHMPFGPGLAVSLIGCNLGAAQAMVNLFQERMKTRVPLFTQERQDDMVSSQVLLAESSVRLDASEKLMYRYADELMEVGEALVDGETLDEMEFRLRTFGWRAFIASECRAVGEDIFQNAGAFTIYAGNPMQRFWRDMHAIAQHVVFNYEVGMRNYGRHLLGQEPLQAIY